MDTGSQEASITQLASQGYNLAVGLLARREHSVTELRSKLNSKLVSRHSDQRHSLVTVVNVVIEKLLDDGYLSDQRFTEAYARARCRKGFGAERIKMELAEKGITPELAASVLSEMEDLWPEAVMKTWQKKFGLPPADYQQKVKQQNFLRYRGYRFQDIECLFESLEDLMA